MIGQTVSHYTIIEKLGEGGMGVVYKAHDTNLDRDVALKFLPPHLAASEADKARFMQEAKAASAINHPNICTIYSIEEFEGRLFIAMEFIDGQTLRDLVRLALPIKRAIDIGMQIADGLAAAHEKGIVHRDIKPENIMIRKDGIAQIMDFGLAKLRAGGSKINRLTKEGSTVGTAGYMSPEQIQGQDADHRSDIFSLGVLLYELFTGQLPFRGVHETALAYEIVNVDPAPMSTVKPDVDPSLDGIVLECLEKDPNERTQAAKQISIDLKRFKRESSRTRVSRITAARPVPKLQRNEQDTALSLSPRTKILWPLVTGLLVVALLILGWIHWREAGVSRPIERFVVTLPGDQTVAVDTYNAIAISPDGSRIVYRANGRLYQKKIDSFDTEPITGTEDGTSPFFSPDGRWLGFFASGKLKKVPLSGGPAVIITDAQNNRGATWTKDGTIIFTPAGREGFFRVNENRIVQRLTTADTVQNERTHRWPQILPDGKTLLFTIGTMDSPDYYDDATIASVNIETGERRVIMKGASMARYIATGYLIYPHGGTVFAVPFDLSRLEVKGSSFPVLENISGDLTTGASNYAIADDGTLAYIQGSSTSGSRTLALIDRSGNVSMLDAPVQAYVDPCFSPDGKHIAAAVQNGKDFDIWVYDIQRKTISQLTFDGSDNRSPIWSPDGRRIAYSHNAGGKAKLIIRQADGSGTAEETIINNIDRTYANCWSRDGSNIIFTIPQPGMGWDLWVLPLNGDHKPWTFLSSKFDESYASLSPDGKWLAYLSNETGVPQVYVRPFPHGEGKWKISTAVATGPRWSVDGKTLYYSGQQGVMSVPVDGRQSLIVGQPQFAFKNPYRLEVESGVTYDIAPDGQHILITKPKDGENALQRINVVTNWFDEINKTVSAGK